MKIFLLLFLLIASCSIFAQVNRAPIHDPAWLRGPNPCGSPVTDGIRFWWVARDNTTNTPITNWVDRIQGSVLTNTAANAPQNAVDGATFTGTNSVLAFQTVWQTAPTGTVFMILRPETVGFFGGLQNTTNSFGLYTASDNNIRYINGAVNTIVKAFTPGTAMDFNFAFKTNDFPFSFYYIGWSTIGSQFYKGAIQEIIVYSDLLSSAQLAQLHCYGTNTYGYSP